MINKASRAKILTGLGGTLNPKEEQKVVQSKISSNIWSYTSTTAKGKNL